MAISKNKKIELLSPAGSLSKLKYALNYGADAVYCGVPDFSLRVRVSQFTLKDLVEAVKYTHEKKKKIYVTLNIYAHNKHLEKIKKHLKFLAPLGIDGLIVSDPGIINLAKEYLPKCDIHLSTQANATNWQAVKFWHSQGIRRIILAREVNINEIKEIKKRWPQAELEYFVHGAMCMSYSGRCILSKWMANRSANLGDCAQPCRWPYHGAWNMGYGSKELTVVDDHNKHEMNVTEDKHGTYFFNSYDLNLIEYVKDLIGAGAVSLKIEGRAKSAYYVAVVTRAYRKVIDAMENKVPKKELRKIIKEQKTELDNLTHRGYTTGFLLGGEPEHNLLGKIKKGKFEFVGETTGMRGKLTRIRAHNAVFLKDEIEAVTPDGNIKLGIKRILDSGRKEILEAHGGHKKEYYFEFDKILPAGSLIRKKISE